jgi:hypothetical protein
MIGRTSEYVGKKITEPEIKMTILDLVAVPAATLGLTSPLLPGASVDTRSLMNYKVVFTYKTRCAQLQNKGGTVGHDRASVVA